MQGREREEEEGRREFLFSPSLSSFSSSYLPPRPPPAPPDDFSSSSLVTRTPYYPLFVSPSSSSSSSSSSFRNQDQRPPLLLSHLPACSTSSLPSSSSCVDSDFLAFRRSHRSPSQSFISSSTEEEREKEEDEEERKQFSLSHCSSSRVFPPSVRDKSQTLLSSSSSSCMYRNGEGSPSEEERNLPKDQEEEKEKKQNEEDGCLRSVEARLRRNKDTSEMRWARRERRRIERSEGSSFFYPRNSHQQTSSPRGLSPSHLSFVSSSLPLSLEEEASALFPSLVSSSGDLSFFFSNRENSVLSSPAHLSHPPCVLDRVRSLQQASLLSAYYCQRGREEKKKDEERRRRRERERRGEKMRKNGKETTSRDRDKEEIDAEETGRRNRRTGPSFFLSREDTEEEEEIKDAVFFNERGRNVEEDGEKEDIGENTREDQFVAREKEGVSIPSSSSFGMAAGAVYRHLRTGANETFFTCLCRSRQSPSEICRSSSSSLLSCYEKVDQRSNRLPAVGLDKVSTRKVEKPLSTRNLFYSHDEEEVEEEGDFFLRDISLPLVLQDLVFDSLLFLPSTSFISPLSSPASSLLLTLQRSRRRRRSKEKRKVLLSSSFSSSSLSLSREKMTSDLHGMSWLASSGMFRLMCWSLLNRRFSIEVSRLVQDSKVLLAFPSLYICLARALLNLDRVDDLLKLLTVDIPYGRLHPSISASLHVLLGDAYEALGSISHSIDALSTSVSYLHALHASTESSDEEEEEKNLLSFSTHSFSYPFSFLQHKRLQKKQLSSSFFSPSPSSSSSPHSCSSPSSVSSLSSSSSLDENLEAPEEEEIPHAVINKSKEKKEKKRKKKKTEEEESQREDSLVSLFALSSKEALRKKKKRKRKIKDEEEERRRRREISPCMHFSIVGALDRLIGRGRLSPREEEKTIRNLLLLSLLPSSERWWSDFFASRLSFSSGSDYYFHRKRKRGRASPSNLSLSSSSYLRFSSSSSHLLSPSSSSSSFEDFTMSIEDGNPLACWETAHFLLSHSPSSLPRPLAVSSLNARWIARSFFLRYDFETSNALCHFALLSNPYDEEALALRAFSLYHIGGRRRARTVSSLENLLLSPFSSSPLPPLLVLSSRDNEEDHERGLAHLVRREEKEGREEEEEEEEEESLHLAKNCFLLACDRIRMQQTSPCSSSSLRVSTWELLFMTFQALSEVYRHLKEFDLVQTISVRALSLQPGNSQVYLHLGMDYLQESEACQEEAERKDFLTRADLFLTRALEIDPENPFIHNELAKLASARNEIDCAVTYLEKAVLCSVYTPLLSSIFLCNLGIAYLQTKAFRRSQKTFEASLLSYRRHVQHSSSSFSPSLFSRNRVFSLLSPSSLSFFLKKKERDEAYLSYFLLKKSDRSCRRSRNVFLSSYRNLFSKRILKKKRRLLFSQRCAMTESFFTRNEREEEEEGRRRRENLMKSLLEAGDKRALKEERFREKKEREKEEEKSIEEEEDYQEEEDSTVSSLDENVLEGEDEESGEEDLVTEEEREEEEERNEKEFLINLWFGLGMALYVQRDSRCIRSLEKALSLTKSLGLPFSQDSYLASSSLPFLPMKDFSLSSSSPSQGVASYPFLILLVYIAALNDLGPSSSFSSLKTSSFFLDHPLHNEEEEEDEREEVLSVSSLLASMLSSRSCMRSEEERETGDKPHDKRRAAKRIEQSLQRQERRVDKEEEEKRRRGEDGRDTSSEKVVSFFSPKRDRNKSAREREKERTERFYEEILRNFDASNLQQEEEKL